MTRRVFMWIAVASLVGLGLVSAASSLASLSQTAGGGVTLYSWTAFSPTPPTLAMRILEASGTAQMILFPIAALSSAGYLLLLDRDVRRGAMTRGFEVEAVRRGDGT